MSSQHMAQRIELWPIDRLIPYARNPRTHSHAQVAQIAASIVEFGFNFNSPILVDTKAGVIAGHGRLLTARPLQTLTKVRQREQLILALLQQPSLEKAAAAGISAVTAWRISKTPEF